MAEEQDQEQKTEDPTAKRLEEAREKGNVAFSRELGSFFMIGILALTIAWFAPYMLKNAKLLLIPFIADADSLPTDRRGLAEMLKHLAFGSMMIIISPLLACVVAAFASSFLQNGIITSTESMMPKLERISPLAGLKRIFSVRSIMEFVKGIVKITVVSAMAFAAIHPELHNIPSLSSMSTEYMLLFLAKISIHMMVGIVVAMFFIALLDIFFQRWQFMKSMRMTKQEIKDEYKQSEGDPVIKQRLRALRMERARKRMMSAVPDADVVVTNPTHFAVALKYESSTMNAPTIVAKGQDLIALKIREIAEENKVPIVENPPLARALFSSGEVDQEIPVAHYEAVAKVISYVYQLKGKGPMIATPGARRL